jgi:hypothetical protein
MVQSIRTQARVALGLSFEFPAQRLAIQFGGAALPGAAGLRVICRWRTHVRANFIKNYSHNLNLIEFNSAGYVGLE